MSWRTSPAVMAARSAGRALGMNAPLKRLFSRSDRYEESFHDAMMGAIRKGDSIWDIGANVGLYTRQFAAAAGPEGKVHAFEPSPLNLVRLREAVSDLDTVTVVPVALGRNAGTIAFDEGKDTTSRVSIGAPGVNAIEVEVETADRLIASGRTAAPTLIKLDVEGFELEVLCGMAELLRSPGLHTLCIEVHFGLLEQRGQRDAPREIERLLRTTGFTIHWPDASHLIAQRRQPGRS